MPWRTLWVDDAAALPSLARPWAALARDAAPWQHPDWFAAWWDAFGGGRRLAVCTVWDGEDLAGVLPLLRDGRSLRGLVNAETPSFGPLVRDTEALGVLVATAVRAASVVELSSLPVDDPAFGALGAASAAAGRLRFVEPTFASPVTDTTGSFADYRRRMRRGWVEIERRARKLEREHAAELRPIDQPHDALDVVEAGLRLEAAGWKGRAGTAMLASGATASFYRRVAEDAAGRGALRCSTLRADGRLLAFDLAVLAGRRYHLLKTAFDESARRLAPGLVLRRAVVERCFELDLEAHEFLGHDAPWKRLFATGARSHATMRLYARRPAPAAAYAFRRVVRPRIKSAAVRAGYVPGSLARRRRATP